MELNKLKQMAKLLLYILVGILPFQCSDKHGEEEGYIIHKKGTIYVIENNGKPYYGQNKINIVPNLVIEAKEQPFGDELIDNIKDIAVDKRGNIFISDGGNNRIVVLDSSGRFVRAFGRKGSGPGEFVSIGRISIDTHGH